MRIPPILHSLKLNVNAIKIPKPQLLRSYSVHASAQSIRPDSKSLFEHTTTRWLCNDEQEKKLRYTLFNVEALERIACRSVDAERCIAWDKIGEGSYNKVFMLRFDNGTQAVVRIPCPVVGNVERATASEVATMCYIRERYADVPEMPLPPRVIAWDASYRNPAETPYIILDYAPGVTLMSRWPWIEGESAGAALASIWEIEKRLLGEPLSQNGSLYFADDVTDELRSRPLFHDARRVGSVALKAQLAAKYRIGPTTNREWWRGDYGQIDADRGPWPDMQTMIKSAAEFQLRALDAGLGISPPFGKSKPSDTPLLRRLLAMCIRIAPDIIPSEPVASRYCVLNHPDLNLNNLIVPEDGKAFVRAPIDWQGATVSPLCMQCAIPPAVLNRGLIPVPRDGSTPPWPDNFDMMSEEEQGIVRIHHRFAMRTRYYLQRISTFHSVRQLTLELPHSSVLSNLVPFITRCVADGPLELRGMLMDLQEKWDQFADGPCPIDFSADEVAEHAAAAEALEEYTRNVTQLYREIDCLDDGSVEAEKFEDAQKAMEQCRERWDEKAMKGPFPLFEGAHSYFLS
ncbi:kinase-like domain-containing protein [Rhodofomes roseus]|uniref:Altered inheritance of mitochondria protein 9, mitochondrial n=1 Tax=Rhodofomes roseus TaxID=34475 RepID=A0ABQ8KK07_9APHY|nr:kinase-like domain-containing protein [Rhodofomes roseus]KAH9838304.1 kinase-like domain-containing protein [Rhodofomes roseus]